MRKPRTMSHQRAQFPARALLGVGALLAACTRSQLEVPLTHPGHPHAQAGRVTQTAALTATYGLETKTDGAVSATREHAHDHGPEAAPGKAEDRPATASEPASAVFTCPMHPEIVRKEPGKCPICGMSLVPKKDAK